MSISKLNIVKDDFNQQMEKAFNLIQSANKKQSCFSQDQIYIIYEQSFLKIFLSWEWFIQCTFTLYMSGLKTDTGYTPKGYVNPKDEKHAYELVKGGQSYVGWTTPEIVIEKSKLFFENGEPYKEILLSVLSEINNMKTIRNAIVHMSKEPRNKFETLVRNELKYKEENITPGEFLAKTKKGKDLPIITFFRDLLEYASSKIVK